MFSMWRGRKVKRLLWCSVPPLLERSALLQQWVRPDPGELFCVNYHGTLERDRSSFERQIAWFADNFHCLSEAELSNIDEDLPASSKPRILITFDDGYRSNFNVSAKILRDQGVRAIFFLLAGAYGGGCFDGAGVWSKPISRDHLMTEDQVFEMLEDGHSIGSHTMSHANLGRIPSNSLASEIDSSKENLQKVFGIHVRSFALPFGTPDSFREDSIKSIDQSYEFFFHSFPSRTLVANPKSLGRYCLEPSFGIAELRLRMSGIMNWRYRNPRRELNRHIEWS